MIHIKEEKFLYNDKEETFVVTVREYYLFKWLFMKKESHDYNVRLIGEYTPMPKPKKHRPIIIPIAIAVFDKITSIFSLPL